MDLLDRYLQAVGSWLPKAQRDDIVAELSEDIRTQRWRRVGFARCFVPIEYSG